MEVKVEERSAQGDGSVKHINEYFKNKTKALKAPIKAVYNLVCSANLTTLRVLSELQMTQNLL